MSNRALRAVLILLIGLTMIIFGAHHAFATVVKCDDKIMHAGDICRKHKHVNRTYEERRNLEHSMGWVVVGVGSVVTIAGVGLGIRTAVRRSAQPVYPPPSAPPPGPAWPR